MLTTVCREIAVHPDRVFDQLADGWIFSAWVVGASHIRDVDPEWPAVGARLHHRVGPWPVSIDDTTQVLEVVPGSRLVLQARAWPFGEARVELTIEAAAFGSTVIMAEAPTHGAGRVFDNPLQRVVLRRRNMESLTRLACLAEKRPVSKARQKSD
jgi:uncharacterized protein YndB with AHSA1/START domain